MLRPLRESTTRPTKPTTSAEGSPTRGGRPPQTLLWAEGRGKEGSRSPSPSSERRAPRDEAARWRGWIWQYMAQHCESFWENAGDWLKWKICDLLLAALLMCLMKRVRRPWIKATLGFLMEN